MNFGDERFQNNPVLVTGGARTGTTWVGRTIAKSLSIRYIHEPFNISGPPCSCGVKFNLRYYYVTESDNNLIYDHFAHILGPPTNKYQFLNLLSELKRTKRLRILLSYISSFLPPKPLIKDPSALPSTEWLATKFNMDVVILIRHPAAFVNSYKQLNWSHPFSHFLEQPSLIHKLLYPYKSEIEEYALNRYDIIDQASFLWKLLYYIVRKYQHEHDHWIFVRHEDLSRDPISGFNKIFNQLGLEFTMPVRRFIMEYSNPQPDLKLIDPYSIRRNSKQIISKWKKMLSKSEIERIRKQVEEVSCQFYSDEDW